MNTQPNHDSLLDSNGEAGQSNQGLVSGVAVGGGSQVLLTLLKESHPGRVASRPKNQAFMKREEVAVVLAIGLLLKPERLPLEAGVPVSALIEYSTLATRYSRLNAVGDAGGHAGMGLERDSKGRFLTDRSNRIRAAHYLHNKVATEKVASVIPGMKAGDDLLQWINEKLGDFPK